MKALIDAAISRSRSVLLLLALTLVIGLFTYISMPKEAQPDVEVPIFFTTVVYPGIGAEDAERLLQQPLERELHSVAGLDAVHGWAGEGFAMVRLDFEAGWDNRQALTDIREAVDQADNELPAEAEDPSVSEVDISLFPVLTATLSGPVAERTLLDLARETRDRLEALPGVLEVDIGGDREAVLEVLVDPLVMESYRLSYEEVTRAIQRNNQLVTAGAVDTGVGRIALKVAGTIEDAEDLRDTAIRAEDGAVVRLRDLAEVRRTFKDPESFARINGHPALSLEISKRGEANILEVVASAREIIEETTDDAPNALKVNYLQDMAKDVKQFLGDLENNVIAAILLVVLVIIATMGSRASLLVGLAIPGAFLGGILAIHLLGFTLNIVVLFALILVVGMLVDGTVVVTELADRYIAEGYDRIEAFRNAAHVMAWPITTAIATTLAVFFPMLFWPGFVGEFIIYLPATVIVTLLMSLAMALIFIPVLGGQLGARKPLNPEQTSQIRAAEQGDWGALNRVTRSYAWILNHAIRHPARALLATALIVVGAYGLYMNHGQGVEFFPDVEPSFAQVQVKARGDLAVREADELVRHVEERFHGDPAIRTVYSRTIGSQRARLTGDHANDVIGIIQLELTNWRTREPATEVLDRLRRKTADLPGMKLQFLQQQKGPGGNRPVVLEVRGDQPEKLEETVAAIREQMKRLGGFTDVEDDRPLPGVELELIVDRSEAARFGVDIARLGQGLQTLTDGMLLGTHQPAHSEDEVDIRMRLPRSARHVQQLVNLRIPSEHGLIPLRNFAEVRPVPATGLIKRRDGQRAFTIEADTAQGFLADERIDALETALAEHDIGDEATVRFRGQAEEQAEAADFLVQAFFLSLALMVLILVTQFNRFDQAVLVLSSIIFSTAGVLLALLVRQEPFGVVMSGIGVLALAGVVVNNNIVLIDSYNRLREAGLAARDAALRAGAQRMRPVVLTAVTTILGLTPMVFGWTIDFFGRDFHVGAPSTQYWTQLATAIAGGLAFATPLTLLFTPMVLVWLDRRRPGPISP